MENTKSRNAILLVDDNRDAVDMLAKLLEFHGYEAIPTYEASIALETLDRRPDIQTVIADIRMPKLDGFDFLRVVKVRHLSIQVILVSGHEVTPDDVVPRGATILKKPVDISQLLNLLPKPT